MQPKSILTSISSNTSFNRPTFSKTSGNGGTGAYGEVSDGEMTMYIRSVGWCDGYGCTHLTIQPDILKIVKQYNIGNSIHIVYGAAGCVSYLQVDEETWTIGQTGESAWIGSINPSWMYQITANCTKPLTIVSPTGCRGCDHPGNSFGFVTSGLKQPPTGFHVAKNKSNAPFSAKFYKGSSAFVKCSTVKPFGEEYANPSQFWR